MGLAQRRGDAENARSLSLRLSVSARNHALRNRTGMPQDQRPKRRRRVRGAGGGGVLGAGEDGEGVWPRSIGFQPVRGPKAVAICPRPIEPHAPSPGYRGQRGWRAG